MCNLEKLWWEGWCRSLCRCSCVEKVLVSVLFDKMLSGASVDAGTLCVRETCFPRWGRGAAALLSWWLLWWGPHKWLEPNANSYRKPLLSAVGWCGPALIEARCMLHSGPPHTSIHLLGHHNEQETRRQCCDEWIGWLGNPGAHY